MKSSVVAGGDTGYASQYNNLRDDAKASSYLLAHQQSTPDLTLKVEEGKVYFGGILVEYAGGNSPSFTAPTTNPRIDVLSLSQAGALVRTAGTEAASPTAPDVPSGNMPICQVYNRVGQTQIYDTDQGAGKGYVYKDTRIIAFQIKGMELIQRGTFTNSFNLTGLKGDTDKVYKLILRGRETGGVYAISVGFNADAGSNYDYSYCYFGGTQAVPTNPTVSTQDTQTSIAMITDMNNFFIEMTISAYKSGYRRLLKWDGMSENAATPPIKHRYMGMGDWRNTADEITQINVVLAAAITEGEYWLFRVKE